MAITSRIVFVSAGVIHPAQIARDAVTGDWIATDKITAQRARADSPEEACDLLRVET